MTNEYPPPNTSIYRITLSLLVMLSGIALTASTCEEFEMDEDLEKYLLDVLECDPNDTQPCLCADGTQGVQACAPDGGVWELCICDKKCVPSTEICDNQDNNCNGLVDENAVGQRNWYADRDNDGVGSENSLWISCFAPEGYVEAYSDTEGTKFDCDDEDGLRSPSNEEVCNDSIDNDCDNVVDEAECN